MTIGRLKAKSYKLTIALVAVCVLGGAFLALGNSLINRASCTLYGKSLEREVRYSFVVGCMVKTSNGWVPRSEIRSAVN